MGRADPGAGARVTEETARRAGHADIQREQIAPEPDRTDAPRREWTGASRRGGWEGSWMGLLRSFRFAFRGLARVLARERNARIHLAAGVVALAASLWLGLARAEIALVVLAIALVLAAEVFNTVVERVLDLLHPGHSERVRAIKDMSAAAVLVTALGALAIALLLLVPRLIDRLS
jgi:diacylglycerol kinase (ATP)